MAGNNPFPMALDAPADLLVKMDDALIGQAIEQSRQSPRKRIILPLHKAPSALLQRMLNAIQPGSYIRPHRHSAERAESIVVLRGRLRYLTFSEEGAVFQSLELRPGEGVDTEGGIWHSFQALEPDTVLFEVKPGPYLAENDKEFAAWAPEEFSPKVEEYMTSLV
ncbi:WbuC family cupin fold metalloprotein [Pontiellaceae bacterium B12219]|nr:WbuC family cupin fold metalloprotein [Pontiellaceae bacterium B12219]